MAPIPGLHRSLPLLRRVYSSTKIVGVRHASSVNLAGIFPPIVTPFNPDESIAWDKLRGNLAKWRQEPLSGYLVHGSNGEFAYLSPKERVDVIRVVKEECPAKIFCRLVQAGAGQLVLAGSGCESTRETIEMTSAMAEAGADVAVVYTPCYYKAKMTSPALEKHFTEVADASPIPVVLYSVPANTAIDLPIASVARLSKHPNIIGMKESGGDVAKIGEMVHLTKKEGFQLIAGSASFLLPALTVGAVGGICALANALPAQVCLLQQLFSEGKSKEARELQHRLIAPNNAVTKQFGVPGLKAAMEWFGFYGGPTRRPLLPLTTEESKALEATFTSNQFK